ncbi:MAG: hypothetical protein II767_08975 [Proteobacteria bacterium]|nr:hypothetical protein [Pseudomonadota bacterium]
MDAEKFYARLFSQNERVMKFGLEAIRKALGREMPVRYPHVLVAGTNGKGQVSALWANALHALGYDTGLFTSPHLVDFRERIRVNGRMLPVEEIVGIGNAVLNEYGGQACPEFSGTALTYFECCLVMALRAFARHDVNFGVFEVGLGGRLDATNALNPGLSIITSISRDHEAYLGSETSQIAREKAGIMRSGCPVVCGRQETQVLREEAAHVGCSSFDALGETFDWQVDHGEIVLVADRERVRLCKAGTMPDYQLDNLAVAVFSLLKAEKIGLIAGDNLGVIDGLASRTRWVGRMWPCSLNAAKKLGVQKVILDGAHNPDGVRAFVAAIHSGADSQSPRSLIVNSCGDKALEQMFPQYLQVFAPSSIFVVPIASTKRAMQPADYCKRVGLSESQACGSLADGLEKAAKYAGSDGIVYISGSLYLLGESIQALGETASLDTIDNGSL